MPFFPGDCRSAVLDVLLVALGVPVGAAVAAQVCAAPGAHLAAGRHPPGHAAAAAGVPADPAPARRRRAVLRHRLPARDTSDGQTAVFLPGLLLIMAGLVFAGPWLTMVGARVMARYANRPATLIAARRLADNPKAGFRAISGLMLALFVTSVAVGVITTIVANRGPAPVGSTDAGTGEHRLRREGAVSARHALRRRCARSPAVRSATAIRENPVVTDSGEVGVIACTDLPERVRPVRRRREVIEVPMGLSRCRESASSATVWPAASLTLDELQRLPVVSMVVGTDGSAAAIERTRTVLEAAFPTFGSGRTCPVTSSRTSPTRCAAGSNWPTSSSSPASRSVGAASRSASSAVSPNADGPFSLLRLSGAPVRVLRRVVALESAVPLLAVAAVAIGMGLLAAHLFLRAQMGYTLIAPEPGFYVIVVGRVGSLPRRHRLHAAAAAAHHRPGDRPQRPSSSRRPGGGEGHHRAEDEDGGWADALPGGDGADLVQPGGHRSLVGQPGVLHGQHRGLRGTTVLDQH